MEQIGLPGVSASKEAAYRKVLIGGIPMLLPSGRIISGSTSRDPLNTGDLDVLRAGMIMGKITSGGKYAPSVLGVTTAAYTQGAVEITVSAATAVELVRRIGSSSTFKFTGPSSASGTVRTITVTYSAVNVSTGVITVTAIGSTADDETLDVVETTPGVTVVSGVSEVEEIQTITISGTPTGGNFQLGYNGEWTTVLTFDDVAADVQTALRALTDLGSVTVSGGALPGAAVVVTMVGVDNPSLLELDISSLTGGTPAGTVIATTPYIALVSAVSAVDEIQTLTLTGSPTGGTFRVGYLGEWTPDLAYNVSTADLQTALVALTTVGAGGFVVTGTAGTSYVLTAGSGLAGGPIGLVDIDADLTGTAGAFVIGSFVQPTDGSEIPLCLIPDGYGIKVTNDSSTSVDVPFPKMLIGGVIDASQIVNYPADASLKTWLKTTKLNAVGRFTFDDAF